MVAAGAGRKPARFDSRLKGSIRVVRVNIPTGAGAFDVNAQLAFARPFELLAFA